MNIKKSDTARQMLMKAVNESSAKDKVGEIVYVWGSDIYRTETEEVFGLANNGKGMLQAVVGMDGRIVYGIQDDEDFHHETENIETAFEKWEEYNS